MMAYSAPLCEDILPVIFRYLPYRHVAPATVANTHLRTLACAARVCRVWSEAAIDALYRDSGSIQHLLAVLTQFGRERDIWGREHGVLRGGVVSAEDWKRFRYYARRVRSLDAYDASSLAESVWNTLTNLCAEDTSLLPELQRINGVYLRGRTTNNGIQACLPPHVRVFSLYLHHEASATPPFKAEKLVELRSLSLTPGTSGQGQIVISHALLESLSTLPRLLILRMHDNVCIKRLSKTTPSSLVFPELLELTLGWVSPGGAKEFYATTSFPRLQSLVLKVLCSHSSDAKDVPSSLPAIAARASESPTIRDIDIRLHDWCNPHVDADPCPMMDMLSPLLQCTQLRTLKIHLGFSCENDLRSLPIALCDSDLRSMTDAWPELVILQVWWTPDVPRVAMDRLPPFPRGFQPPTPHALGAFAQAHPHLTDLRLPYPSIPISNAI